MDLKVKDAEGMDRIYLIYNRNNFRAVVNAIMNILVSENVGDFY
jgi:hypothetical protein